MATFDLLAAIDLRGGHVVRLREGDFARETAYSDDPVAVARDLVEQGVRWLHVVDLDGARAGEPVHGRAIAEIVAAVGERASVEVAGGLRTAAAIASVLEPVAGPGTAVRPGAARAVLGTAALRDPSIVGAAVRAHGADRIAVAIDVRDGEAVGQGWRSGADGRPVAELIDELVAEGVRTLEVTAIARDGSLQGPDLELLDLVVRRAGTSARVIASGGIATVEDLLATWTLGCAGAIVGRAIYEGTFDLERAVRATGRARGA